VVRADAWRDPHGQQRFHQRISGYLKDGPPPATERLSREEIRERYGSDVYQWCMRPMN